MRLGTIHSMNRRRRRRGRGHGRAVGLDACTWPWTLRWVRWHSRSSFLHDHLSMNLFQLAGFDLLRPEERDESKGKRCQPWMLLKARPVLTSINVFASGQRPRRGLSWFPALNQSADQWQLTNPWGWQLCRPEAYHRQITWVVSEVPKVRNWSNPRQKVTY